jgi:hypothetical protein
MQTVGHHTCKRDGGSEFVLANAPFIAEYKEAEGKLPFLGEGYYFWDDNLDLAHHWGRVHYRSRYLILEADLQFDEGELLDLVGSRRDMRYFQELRNELLARGFIQGDWEISKMVALLRKLQQGSPSQGHLFPFLAIRAVDHSMAGHNQIPAKFVSQRDNFVLVNPRIIVCMFEKKERNLCLKRIVE